MISDLILHDSFHELLNGKQTNNPNFHFHILILFRSQTFYRVCCGCFYRLEAYRKQRNQHH